jgi:hypothetical protein
MARQESTSRSRCLRARVAAEQCRFAAADICRLRLPFVERGRSPLTFMRTANTVPTCLRLGLRRLDLSDEALETRGPAV